MSNLVIEILLRLLKPLAATLRALPGVRQLEVTVQLFTDSEHQNGRGTVSATGKAAQ